MYSLSFPHQHYLSKLHIFVRLPVGAYYCVLYVVKVIGAKKAGDEQTATVPQVHEHMHISAALPAPQAFHDYAGPVAAEADMLAIVPQADEIFDGILNSLPEIPVANVRYSDFFDPFGDSMFILKE